MKTTQSTGLFYEEAGADLATRHTKDDPTEKVCDIQISQFTKYQIDNMTLDEKLGNILKHQGKITFSKSKNNIWKTVYLELHLKQNTYHI